MNKWYPRGIPIGVHYEYIKVIHIVYSQYRDWDWCKEPRHQKPWYYDNGNYIFPPKLQIHARVNMWKPQVNIMKCSRIAANKHKFVTFGRHKMDRYMNQFNF